MQQNVKFIAIRNDEGEWQVIPTKFDREVGDKINFNGKDYVVIETGTEAVCTFVMSASIRRNNKLIAKGETPDYPAGKRAERQLIEDGGTKVIHMAKFKVKSLDSLPKKYRDAILDVSDETNNGDGWWIYLKEPYFNPQLECRTIHEQRLADCIKILKTCVNDPITKETYFGLMDKADGERAEAIDELKN